MATTISRLLALPILISTLFLLQGCDLFDPEPPNSMDLRGEVNTPNVCGSGVLRMHDLSVTGVDQRGKNATVYWEGMLSVQRDISRNQASPSCWAYLTNMQSYNIEFKGKVPNVVPKRIFSLMKGKIEMVYTTGGWKKR